MATDLWGGSNINMWILPLAFSGEDHHEYHSRGSSKYLMPAHYEPGTCIAHNLSLSVFNNLEVCTIIVPSLQVWKLRHKELLRSGAYDQRQSGFNDLTYNCSSILLRSKYRGNTAQGMARLLYVDKNSKVMEWHVQVQWSVKLRNSKEFGLAIK